jgi:hypothetical protein
VPGSADAEREIAVELRALTTRGGTKPGDTAKLVKRLEARIVSERRAMAKALLSATEEVRSARGRPEPLFSYCTPPLASAPHRPSPSSAGGAVADGQQTAAGVPRAAGAGVSVSPQQTGAGTTRQQPDVSPVARHGWQGMEEVWRQQDVKLGQVSRTTTSCPHHGRYQPFPRGRWQASEALGCVLAELDSLDPTQDGGGRSARQIAAAVLIQTMRAYRDDLLALHEGLGADRDRGLTQLARLWDQYKRAGEILNEAEQRSARGGDRQSAPNDV